MIFCVERAAVAETAQTRKDHATKQAYAGVAALQAGDVVTARKNLDAAYAVLRVPSVALWSARALIAQGDLIEARTRLHETTLSPVLDGDPQIQRAALAEAQRELDALQPRIPTLTLRATSATATFSVELDGRRVLPSEFEHYAVNPGKHLLDVHSEQAHYQLELSVKEGEHRVTTLPLRPAATAGAQRLAEQDRGDKPCSGAGCETTDPRRVAGWLALGAGAAAFIGAGAASYIAADKLDEIRGDPRCGRDACSREAEDRVSEYSTARTWSNVGWLAGGLLTLSGAGLLLFSSESPNESLAVSAAPLRLDLRARF